MYQRSAELYDLLHDARGKDYAAEADHVAGLIRERQPAAATLLDVACGTGAHLEHLQRHFAVEGLEVSPDMLAVARRRLADVDLHHGDMRSFDLVHRFDAVSCLFSSIGYLLTRRDLHKAVTAMVRHLKPGGVLVLEPWFHPDNWWAGYVFADAATTDEVAVARVSRSGRRGRRSTFDYHYTVATAAGVEAFVEHHEMALWDIDEYSAALQAAGLTVEHDPVGLTDRGLFIGRLL